MERRVTDLRRELANNLQIGLATGLVGGGLLGFLGTAASLALNPGLLGSAGNVVRLLIGLQIVYGLLCLGLGLAGAAAKTLFFVATRRSISDTKTSAFAAWTVFFLIGGLYAFSWTRWQKIGGLAPGEPVTVAQIPVLLAVAAVSAILSAVTAYAFYLLIVHVKKPERRRPGDLRRAFLILLYMAGAFVVFLAVARVTSKRPATEGGLTRDAIHPQGRAVALFAIDGLDEGDLDRLQAAGRIGWAARIRQGMRGTLAAPETPVPPMDWTLAATGQSLASHGITDFQAQVVRGLPVPVAIGPDQLGLFELAQNVLPFLRLTRSIPVKSWMRETKGLWNMASDAGKRTVVVNWWVSWPAERVRGAIVSDHAWLKLAGEVPTIDGDDPESRARIAARVAASVQTPGPGMEGALSPVRPDGQPLLLERETWPNTLLLELAPLAWSGTAAGPAGIAETREFAPDDSSLHEALITFDRLGIPRDVLRADLFHARAAAWLFDRDDPALWMLHLPGPDIIRRVLAKRDLPPAPRERARQEALEAYFRAVDPALEPLVAGIVPGVAPDSAAGRLALLLTLPGLPWPDAPPRTSGALALAGPGIEGGAAAGPVELAEVTPTVLWLLGLPVGRDMAGAPRLDLVPGALAGRLSPVRSIPTWGRQETEGLQQAASSLDAEMLERFRALGYIN